MLCMVMCVFISVTYSDWVTHRDIKTRMVDDFQGLGAGKSACFLSTQFSFGLVKWLSLVEVKGYTVVCMC